MSKPPYNHSLIYIYVWMPKKTLKHKNDISVWASNIFNAGRLLFQSITAGGFCSECETSLKSKVGHRHCEGSRLIPFWLLCAECGSCGQPETQEKRYPGLFSSFTPIWVSREPWCRWMVIKGPQGFQHRPANPSWQLNWCPWITKCSVRPWSWQ